MKRAVSCLLIIVLIASCLFTFSEYGTLNAPAVFVGLIRVCLLDAPYVRVGRYPDVFFGNPENGFQIFINAMEEMGYTHHPQEQMGSLYWFTDRHGNWVKVLFRINACYSKWIWC